MVRKIAVICVAAVCGILSYAATRPSAFLVERRVSIEAPPKKVFSLLSDFHAWGLWSPWERRDPAITRTYTGKDRGPGAVYEWAGHGKVGAVRLEILDAVPASRLVMRLDLKGPFVGTGNLAVYALERENGATTVTWTVYGRLPYPAKVLNLFRSVDRMIGDDFEAALANLKDVAE
jgi:uncharacterized protein YndB with AHSA1/START domain